MVAIRGGLAMTVAVCLDLLALAAEHSQVVPGRPFGNLQTVNERAKVESYLISRQNRSKRIFAIHPTVHRAHLRGNRSILETDSLALINNIDMNEKEPYLERDRDLAISTSSSATHSSLEGPDSSSLPHGQLNYDLEIDYLKRHVDLLKVSGDVSPNKGWGPCRPQAFRAFDVVRLTRSSAPKGATFMAVGLGDTTLSVLYYNQTVEGRWKKHPREYAYRCELADLFVDREGKLNKTLYRISAMTIRELGEGRTYSIQAFDESGTVIDTACDAEDSLVLQPSAEPAKLKYLTSLRLDGRPAASDPKVDAAVREARDPSEPGGYDGKVVMERHFDHSFVESIAMLEGSLIYSRCLIEVKRVHFINGSDKWPREMEDENPAPESDIMRTSVQALEAYKHDGLYYYHIFDLKVDKTFIDRSVYYWWCKANTTQEARRLNWPATNSFNCRDYSKPFEVGLAPIDVVYHANCSKVYAFYQHMFQTEDASKYFTNESPFTVVDWMRVPVNAILFQNDRLYLFGPANHLLISKPIDGCSFADVSIESQHYQSDLLLMFMSAKNMVDYNQTVPIFDGERIYEEETGWNPPLNKRKPIEKSYRLGARSSSSSVTGAIIVIVLVLIILIAILVGAIIYYFIFTKHSRQPHRRLVFKSGLRRPRDLLAAQSSLRSALPDPAGTPSSLLAKRSSELNQKSVRSNMSKNEPLVRLKSAVRKSVKSRSPGIPPSGSPIKTPSGSSVGALTRSPSRKSGSKSPSISPSGKPNMLARKTPSSTSGSKSPK